MDITRKQFLMSGLALLGAGVLTACGGGDEEGGGVCDEGTSITFTDQHGHEILVSRTDVLAGVEKTYMTSGTADHQHMIVVTAAHFATIAAGGTALTMTNFLLEHMHDVRIRCVT
jgi:hypothetical protein